MPSSFLNQTEWETIFATDPGIGVAIVTREGEVVFATQSALSIFGVDPHQAVPGKRIHDFFHAEFAAERLGWIQRVAEEHKPLTVRHIYQGKSIVSTLMPADAESGHVLILSRLGSPLEGPATVEEVRTDLVDLGPLAKLSDRELEVLVLLGHGRSVPETAKLLHRSPRTIERHKEEIGRKLGASTIAQIVKIVNRLGLSVDHLNLKRLQALRPEVAAADNAGTNANGEASTTPPEREPSSEEKIGDAVNETPRDTLPEGEDRTKSRFPPR